jgi:hypothetical protein
MWTTVSGLYWVECHLLVENDTFHEGKREEETEKESENRRKSEGKRGKEETGHLILCS